MSIDDPKEDGLESEEEELEHLGQIIALYKETNGMLNEMIHNRNPYKEYDSGNLLWGLDHLTYRGECLGLWDRPGLIHSDS